MSVPPAIQPFLCNQLFGRIAPELLVPVLECLREEAVEPGTVLFEEGDGGEDLYLIAEGSVKISKRGRGGLQETLTHLTAGDFFGEMALIDDGRRSAQATTDSRTVLGRMDRATWSRLLQAAPEQVMANCTRAFSHRLRENNEKFIEEMLRNERLSLLGATVSSIVHDMNNPIACILGACQLLQRDFRDNRAAQMTDIIYQSVERMQTMTQEMLDFARGTTQLSLQPISSNELLQQLEHGELALCAPAGIAVEKEIRWEGMMHIDTGRIVRMLENLIKNAREAMSPGGKLRLTVNRAGAFVVMELADTGCGIPPEVLPRIFEPFATSGKKTGTGLGLAISKAAVEAHRGTIGVRSSVGEGTTFTVRLPLGD